MGLVKLLSHLVTAWVAFLHPCFASYKALSNRPVSEPDLERWVKYWSIVGAIVGVEYAAEWIVSWVPFYWEIKTIFVLYLALPQTQGSTYIYDSYLAPYFIRNEAAIDAGIANAQGSLFGFLQDRLRALWDLAWKFGAQVQAAQSSQSQASGGGAAPAKGSPADVVSNLWRAYGPSVMTSLTRASAPSPGASQSDRSAAPQSSTSSPALTETQPYTRPPFSTSVTE